MQTSRPGGLVAVMIGAALVGPILQYLWRAHLPIESAVRPFATTFIRLIWPTQLLGVFETTIGTPLALFTAVSANILLYAAIFGAVFLARKKAAIVVVIWISVCIGSATLAAWMAGFDYEYFSVLAWLAACIFQAVVLGGWYRLFRNDT